MIPTAVGIIIGIRDSSKNCKVILGGGTQMVSVYAVLKHLHIDLKNISIATTKYVYEDTSCNLKDLQKDLNFDLIISDPKFEKSNLPGINRYTTGTIKEGAGAGGLLYYALYNGIKQEKIIEKLEILCHSIKAGQK